MLYYLGDDDRIKNVKRINLGDVFMNVDYKDFLVQAAVKLSELAAKGTAGLVNAKIASIKNEDKLEKVRNDYDEIISNLLSEREEIIRIAQIYKNEIDRIEISNEDIEHLHNTISQLLEIIKDAQLSSIDPKDEKMQKQIKEQINNFEQIKKLITVDTLKTMQLLGFNYKAAIGEPLTLKCASIINSIKL